MNEHFLLRETIVRVRSTARKAMGKLGVGASVEIELWSTTSMIEDIAANNPDARRASISNSVNLVANHARKTYGTESGHFISEYNETTRQVSALIDSNIVRYVAENPDSISGLGPIGTSYLSGYIKRHDAQATE